MPWRWNTICYAETMSDMKTIAGYHEGIAIEANVVYTLRNIFNAQMQLTALKTATF